MMQWDGPLWLCSYVVGCDGMSCDAMWLCDVANLEMMCCELPRAHDSKTLDKSIPLCRERLGCKTKKKCGGLMSQCYDSVLQTATLCYMVIATFSCLVIVKHETSNKLPRATKASKTQWN